MTDGDFEARLGGQLRRLADLDLRSIDPLAMATAAIEAERRRTGWAWTWVVRRQTVVASVALLATAALVVGLLIVSASARRTPGSQLAFVRGGDVYLATGDGTNPRRLATGGADAQRNGYTRVAIAPDGRHLAAILDDRLRGADGFAAPQTVAILTTSGSEIGALDVGSIVPSDQVSITRDISWSPDSTELAVLVDAGREVAHGLYVIGLDGHVVRQLQLPPFFIAFSPITAWSPDGRSILVTGGPSDYEAPGLWLVAPDGSAPRQLVEGTRASSVWAAAWSPDGTEVAFTRSSTISSAAAVEIVSVLGGTPRALPLGPEAVLGLAWSADSRRIAVAGLEATNAPAVSKYHLDVIASDGSAGPLTLISGQATEPTMAPNGSQLPFTLTGEYLSGGLGWWDSPAWTAEGQSIVYRSLSERDWPTFSIRIVPADGGPSQVLIPNVDAFDFGWSP